MASFLSLSSLRAEGAFCPETVKAEKLNFGLGACELTGHEIIVKITFSTVQAVAFFTQSSHFMRSLI